MTLSNLKEIDKLTIRKGDETIGLLTRSAEGVSLSYTAEYLATHSDHNLTDRLFYSLPLRKAPYYFRGESLPPELAGLLPEGLRLNALIKAVKTSPSDLFSLAASLGEEVPGDIWLGETSTTNDRSVRKDFSDVLFSELFEESLLRTTVEEKAIDADYPGVQPKISARIVSFPTGVANRKKRYIVKLPSSEFPASVRNELFFMRLAKACGIWTANVSTVVDRAGVEALLVERFDRVYSPSDKTFAKLHTEDACQFLQRYPQDKYRINLREIAARIVEVTSAPKIELIKLLELVVFSYLIGNGDLHGKNISLITDISGRIRLSPAYDLLSTLPYGDDSMALAFEGNTKSITVNNLIQFCKAFEISEILLKKRLTKLAAEVEDSIPRLNETGLQERKVKQLKDLMCSRLTQFLSHMKGISV